jgi:hypothetical protein
VTSVGTDPTLLVGGAGLFLRGRGSNHQIDAIADYLVFQPFSNPHRLLCEAKFYANNVSLKEVRNAVGVLKDVGEYWVSVPGGHTARKRFHYQYALFSATGFSSDAQRYAFAQDIYLIPLGDSHYFKPILHAIRQAVAPFYSSRVDEIPDESVSHMRQRIRRELDVGGEGETEPVGDVDQLLNIGLFLEACRRLNFVLLGVVGGSFPILLAPSQDMRHGDIPEHMDVRIYWNDEGWHLRDIQGRALFSFDFPKELFELYAEEGTLSRHRALDLKLENMSFFQALYTVGGRVRLISFELDHAWLEAVRFRHRERDNN